MNDDTEIEGIQVINKTTKEKVIDIPRKDICMLTKPNPYLNKDINEDIKEDAILFIKKPDLNPLRQTKWDFLFEGRIINSVSITDVDFVGRVKAGEKFGNGDKLKYKLKTTQRLDVETGAYLDCKLEIVSINQIIGKNE